MSEEATTPDLAELTRRQLEAVNRRDMDAVMRRCPPDGVYDTSPDGLGVYEGPAAIRAFLREWWDAFEELAFEPEDVLDLGHGFVFLVVCQKARLAGSTGRLERREAYVLEWVEDMIRRLTVYTDIDEGRGAAERLAAERGQAMSQENVETVRQLIAFGERARENLPTSPPVDLVAPDIEIDLSRRVFNPETYRGFEGLARMNEELREVWEEWHVTPERIVAVGDLVVSIETVRGRGRGSGLETEGRYASIWTFVDGRATRVEVGFDPDEALKAVGLQD